MVSAEGNRFKLIGQIQLIDAPNAAEFRGPDGKGGTKFQLIHSGLADEEGAKNQEMGWTSSLRNLEAEVAA